MTTYEKILCRDLYRRTKNPNLPIKVKVNRGFLERPDVQNYLDYIDREEKMHSITNYVMRGRQQT